jgi:hypothetical protein
MGVLNNFPHDALYPALGGSWEFPQGPFYLPLLYFPNASFKAAFSPVIIPIWYKTCQSMAQELTNIVK